MCYITLTQSEKEMLRDSANRDVKNFTHFRILLAARRQSQEAFDNLRLTPHVDQFL